MESWKTSEKIWTILKQEGQNAQHCYIAKKVLVPLPPCCYGVNDDIAFFEMADDIFPASDNFAKCKKYMSSQIHD